jgi:hypothetical protein
VDQNQGRRRRRALIVTCGLAALAVLGIAALTAPLPSPLEVALFGGLLVFLENTAVMLPSSTRVSPSFMVVMASITVHGDGVVLRAAVVAVFGGLILDLVRKRYLGAVAFNCAQYALAAAGAAGAYQAMVANGMSPAVPLLVAALVFATVNMGLVVAYLTVAGERSAEVWANMRPGLPNYLAFGLLGTLVGQLFDAVGALAMVLLLTPLLIARSTFRAFLELKEAREATIKVFLRAIQAKDAYTGAHTERVAKYSVYIGERLGFGYGRLEHLRQAALMHDIGKLAVPKHLLNKPGRLTDEEFSLVRRHAHVCIDILNMVDFLRPMTAAAAGHHTRYDGGGYGGTGDQIKEAFIVTVADAYDAMTSTRAYRKALPMEVAFEELRAQSGSQFDPECVEALVAAIEARGEKHGAGYEEDVVEYEVEPPDAGVGSAGLGNVIASSPGEAASA